MDIWKKAEFFDFVQSEDLLHAFDAGKNSQNGEVFYCDAFKIPKEKVKETESFFRALLQSIYVDSSNSSVKNLQKTIGIDCELLNNIEILSALKLLYEYKIIYGIRLLPEGSTLNKEIYEKFNNRHFDDDFCMICDNCEVDCRFDLRVQNNVSKIEKTEVYNKENQTFELHNNIHINRELTEEELKEVVKIANEKKYDNLFLNFYDPSYYEDALLILKNNGLNSDIKITLLANPLYDMVELYSNLGNVVDNTIKIHYNTCNDLNELYRNRKSEIQNFYSDIEASDICDLEDYINLLNFVLDIEKHIEEKKYTDLEKVSFVYDYFKKTYIYDPDYEQNSHQGNSKLHLVSQKDRMVCEGFSNLFSCVLRRSGVMCFTVGTDTHQYNIVKLLDDKYDVNNLAILDITWDIGKTKEINDNFHYFLRTFDAPLYDPSPSTLNIATSLMVSDEFYQKHYLKSNPGYITDCYGYAYRMLELMGLVVSKEDPTPDDIRSALMNSGLINMIPSEKLKLAINEVRKKEGDNYSDFYPQLDARNFKKIIPYIKDSYVNDIHYAELHKTNSNITFDFVESQNKILFPPKSKENLENMNNYLDRIKTHFHNMFYSEGVVLNKNVKQEEKTIDDKLTEIEEGFNLDNSQNIEFKDYYKILGVSSNASMEIIYNAYVHEYNSSKNTDEKKELLDEAINVLFHHKEEYDKEYKKISSPNVEEDKIKISISKKEEKIKDQTNLDNSQNIEFKDYYKILGVSPNASMQSIYKAYDREYNLSKHIDNKIKLLKEAFYVLCNYKEEYDKEYKKVFSFNEDEDVIEIPYSIDKKIVR